MSWKREEGSNDSEEYEREKEECNWGKGRSVSWEKEMERN